MELGSAGETSGDDRAEAFTLEQRCIRTLEQATTEHECPESGQASRCSRADPTRDEDRGRAAQPRDELNEISPVKCATAAGQSRRSGSPTATARTLEGCPMRCAVRRDTVTVRCMNRLGPIIVLSMVSACADSGASSTTNSLPVHHPSTTISAVAAVAITTPETSTTSTSLSLTHGEILVAAPGSPTPPPSNGTAVLFDAQRAFSTPSGTIVFQRADDPTIRIDRPDGSTHVAISPAPKTHLRLYDAGLALGVESILYSVVDEDDVALEVLHLSNLDGSNSRTLGNIGFWEGWTNAAHLGRDRVVSEELTAGSFYPTTFDLHTGGRTDLSHSTASATRLSVSDDAAVDAHMENNNLVVSPATNSVGSITIPLPAELVDRLYSIDITAKQAIINTTDTKPVLITFPANLTGHTTIAALGVTGYASFIEHPTPPAPNSTESAPAPPVRASPTTTQSQRHCDRHRHTRIQWCRRRRTSPASHPVGQTETKRMIPSRSE
jgi:hypothetical protein